MLVDLVSPWAAALGSPEAIAAFRARHVDLLAALRRQRALDGDELALANSPVLLERLLPRAADPGQQQLIRDLVSAAADHGADVAPRIVLLAGADEGDAAEPLPLRPPQLALFLDRATDLHQLTIALARGLAALTRWCARESGSALRPHIGPDWDRWTLAREVPLAEWLYTEGVGRHLARLLLPSLPPHAIFGVTIGAYHRLREREHALRALLEPDLGQAGIGLILRWLTPGAPASARRRAGLLIPPDAGPYLAYRMLEPRVERVGIREAIRMAV